MLNPKQITDWKSRVPLLTENIKENGKQYIYAWCVIFYEYLWIS
jgi:hypothetical protein